VLQRQSGAGNHKEINEGLIQASNGSKNRWRKVIAFQRFEVEHA
jgi:hypothetical protein